MRKAVLALLILVALGGGVLLYAFAEARSVPVVHRATLALDDWPRGQAPITVVLISDIHIGSSAMDGARLTTIVHQINALRPDLVLIAGDFIFGHDIHKAAREAKPLADALSALRAPLGTVAVLGNHDWWTGQDDVRAALRRAGVAVLINDATTRGPLAIAGVADDYTAQSDVPQTWARVGPLSGARIVLTHSPDIEPALPPGTAPLLAGHTHCGQVVLPLIGSVDPVVRVRFTCGRYDDHGRSVIVTGGLGTSGAPFRLNAPPDMWLLRMGPANASIASANHSH